MKTFLSIPLLLVIVLYTSYSALNTSEIKNKIVYADESEKIDLYCKLVEYYYVMDDVDSCNKFSRLAIGLALKSKNHVEIIDTYNNAAYYNSYYNPDTSIFFANKVIAIAKENKTLYGTAAANAYIGYSFIRLNDRIEKAYFEKAIKIADEIDDEMIKAFSYANIGDFYKVNDDYKHAIESYTKALAIYDEYLTDSSSIKDQYNYGQLANSLGIAFKNLDKLEEAKKYYMKYKDISVKVGDDWGLAISLNNLGNLYNKEGDNELALENYKQAMSIFQKSGNVRFVPDLMMNMGNIHTELGNYEIAMKNFEQSLDLFEKYSDTESIAKLHTNMGDMYLKSNDLSKAKQSYEKSVDISSGLGANDILLETYQKLSQIYEKQNSHRKALSYYKQYMELKDSVFSIEKVQEIGKITAKYEIDKKQMEEERQQAEKDRIAEEELQWQNTVEYSGIMIFVIIFFTLIFILGKFNISEVRLESMVFVAMLLLFEFILVVIEPFEESITGGGPAFKMMINFLIALAFTPLDTYSEKYLRNRVIEKNK